MPYIFTYMKPDHVTFSQGAHHRGAEYIPVKEKRGFWPNNWKKTIASGACALSSASVLGYLAFMWLIPHHDPNTWGYDLIRWSYHSELLFVVTLFSVVLLVSLFSLIHTIRSYRSLMRIMEGTQTPPQVEAQIQKSLAQYDI